MRERWIVIGILLLFLIFPIGILIYSLPSNIYSPEKNSLTEVGLLQFDNENGSFRAHIYLNTKPVEVRIGLKNIRTVPEASMLGNEVEWKGVYSKRSRIFYQGSEYESLYYEGSLTYTNPLQFSVVKNGKVSATITNNGEVPIENIFVMYRTQPYDRPYRGYLGSIDAGKTKSIVLEERYISTDRYREIMEDAGISKYATRVLNYDGKYDLHGLLIEPRQGVKIAYQLPKSEWDLLVPLSVEGVSIKRFIWATASSPTQEGFVLDLAHHHLGDNKDQNLTPPSPEGITYTKTFTLKQIGEALYIGEATLNITTKNVVATDAFGKGEYYDYVYINGFNIGKLNDYVTIEGQDYTPRTMRLPIDSSVLHTERNIIEIKAGSNANKTNYDDFEFYDLRIEISGKPRPVLIPSPPPPLR